MFLDTRVESGFNVLNVGGELGGPDDATLIERVRDLMSGPGASLIVDLSEVTFINSTGINTLVRMTAQANVQEQRIVYAGPSPMVAGVLRTTQLDRFLAVFPTTAAAAKGLAG